jgi:hypothetical protein
VGSIPASRTSNRKGLPKGRPFFFWFTDLKTPFLGNLPIAVFRIVTGAKTASPLEEETPMSTNGEGQPASGHAVMKGPIQTRTQALEQLRMVADFFRRTEPHSPVAYLADKAAAWGDLPLHAWLRTVVKDQGSLAHIEEMLGLHTSPGEN